MENGGNKTDQFDMEAFFAGVIQEGERCEIEEINPSLSGWQIILYFDTSDPFTEGTQAEEDLEHLKTAEKIGIMGVRFEKKPQKRAVLTYTEDCGESSFSPEILAILKRYTSHATALPGTRKPKAKVESVRPAPQSRSGRASVPEIIDGMRKQGEPLITEIMSGDGLIDFDKKQAEAMYNLNFETIVISLNPQDPAFEEICAKLKDICEEEDLEYEEDKEDKDEGIFNVTISKKREVTYKLGTLMEVESVYYIVQFPYLMF